MAHLLYAVETCAQVHSAKVYGSVRENLFPGKAVRFSKSILFVKSSVNAVVNVGIYFVYNFNSS